MFEVKELFLGDKNAFVSRKNHIELVSSQVKLFNRNITHYSWIWSICSNPQHVSIGDFDQVDCVVWELSFRVGSRRVVSDLDQLLDSESVEFAADGAGGKNADMSVESVKGVLS